MIYDIDKFVVDECETIKRALLKVEENSCGLIFVQNNAEKIV